MSDAARRSACRHVGWPCIFKSVTGRIQTFVLAAGLLSLADAGRAPAVVAEPPPGHFYHGVYPGGESGWAATSRPRTWRPTTVRGKAPTWVYFCDNWYEGRGFPWSTASWIRDGGSIPYIRMMLMSANPIRRPIPSSISRT